ncbi:hypothetical protein QBC36DRAFT_302520 [Triangularia setosa]|uniref:Uncharacterized protein n=1 Tax=Triangularia setosa TaxID=2587417 RepID=A0AAN6W3M3_9PEZI|nr:hypothetical protein QBC36DRAFT_302520 [Podospora setosa]
MKNLGIVALSGAVMLQVASAACCRSNKCLKAVVFTGDDGLADCSSNLAVTVTPSAVTLIETLTMIESAMETALFTETSTEIASTETVLFTEATTVTAATQTNVILETTTAPITTTVVESAVPVTTTSFVYQVQVTARDVASDLPDYVTAVCADWDNDAITTTVATLSSTQTDIVTVTETTFSTAPDIVSLTECATVTDIATASETTTVFATSTPTVVAPLTCKPAGTVFRASVSPFYDGSSRWMNVVNNNIIAWQSFGAGVAPNPTDPTSTWTLDSNGHLVLKYVTAGQTEIPAAFMDKSKTGATVQVSMRPKTIVEAAVAAGTYVRVKACIHPITNEVILSGMGRTNMIECGNGLYLSTGTTGTDIRSDCHLIQPKES